MSGVLQLRACRVRLTDGVALRDGTELPLTTKERDVLDYLAERVGQTVSREDLLVDVWAYHPTTVTRAVDMVVARLRRKIELNPARPDHLLTVTGTGYRFEVAPCEVLDVVPLRTNLAPALSTFVGRADDLLAVDERVRAHGLVTVMGPPGVGKTRLALEYGRMCLDRFGGGVWFCALADAWSEEDLRSKVADVLGASNGDVGAALAQRGPTLLILDNLEQLVDLAPAVLGAWRRAAPLTRFLATTSVRLGLEGEHTWRLEPLDRGAALQLLHDRTDGGLDEADEVLVALVERVDRLPLAIELAAGKLGLLSPSDLLKRLSGPKTPLRSSRRDRADRQTTLDSAIAWAWDLLEPHERDLLAQCTVFRGGFGLEAAERVLCSEDGPAVLDGIHALWNKSLLDVRTVGGQRRFGLLPSIAAFAAARLDPGTASAVRARHARYYLGLDRALADSAGVYGAMEPERENLLVARQALTSAPSPPASGIERARLAPPARPARRLRNVTTPRNEFVGRALQLTRLARMARPSLATLVGPPGVGKTRLAVERAVRAEDVDEAWFCDLSHATSAAHVVEAVADTLGITARDAEAIGGALASRGRVLLVLDNLEQVVDDAGPLAAGWSRGEVEVLATSRIPLGVGGEEVVAVEPLEDEDGVRLLISRAGDADLDHSDSALRIVRAVDGLPLAIELAAARLDVLSPRALEQRLGATPGILGRSTRRASERHTTLEEAISWSWDLLTEHEQAALTQLTVFVGGCDLDAAESVIRLARGAPPVLEVIEGLRRASLVRAWTLHRGGRRFRRLGLLSSIAAFASARLGDAARPAAARHAVYYVDLAERRRGRDDLASQLLRGLERGNLLAAYGRSRGELRALALIQVHQSWQSSSYDWSNEQTAVVLADASLGAEVRARVLKTRASTLGVVGPRSEAVEVARRAAEAFAVLGDDDESAGCLADLAVVHLHGGDLEAAHAALRDGFALAPAGSASEAMLETISGALEFYRGRYEAAERHMNRAIVLHTALGAELSAALSGYHVGVLLLERGERAAARVAMEQALRSVASVDPEGWLMGELERGRAELSLDAGDPAAAEANARRSLALLERCGHLAGQAATRRTLGCVLWELSRYTEAEVQLRGAIDLAVRLGMARENAYSSLDLCGLFACERRTGAARDTLESARAAIADASVPAVLVRLIEAQIALGEGRADLAHEVIAEIEGDAPPAGRLYEARLLVRALRRHLAERRPSLEAPR